MDENLEVWQETTKKVSMPRVRHHMGRKDQIQVAAAAPAAAAIGKPNKKLFFINPLHLEIPNLFQ